MSPSKRRVILLAGAPTTSDLIWDEQVLLTSFLPAIKPYLSEQIPPTSSKPLSSSLPSQLQIKWRSVALPQNSLLDHPLAVSLAHAGETRHNPYATAAETEDEEFHLHHSLALHTNAIESASFFSPTGLDSINLSTSFPSAIQSFPSFYPSSPSAASPRPFPDADEDEEGKASSFPAATPPARTTLTLPLKPPGPTTTYPSVEITPLSTLPTAKTLNSLEPQTVTKNLIVAIIDVSPARTVVCRPFPGRGGRGRGGRGGGGGQRTMDIISLFVGDETSAGFEVNFWVDSLPLDAPFPNPPHPHKTPPPHQRSTISKKPTSNSNSYSNSTSTSTSLRHKLESLRKGDILLLTSIALSHYEGRVSGTALPVWRGRSKIEVLEARFGSGSASAALPISAAMREKFDRVREWGRRFVPGGGGGEVEKGGGVVGKRKGAAAGDEVGETTWKKIRRDLPEDTQE
ncbi:hypothetical protein K402DRAFT_395919 [Aulographum hederae CBS 113979]|uniref:Uncharacterized protein n=1 Tax=Aulographum hederae CBS 113979 TaxID=1176131 RepID=A0A6G1GU27_9PEZI|nr:hypothetical protein K402DRAFT_395919 [Aulographum hederae CBS 113979]